MSARKIHWTLFDETGGYESGTDTLTTIGRRLQDLEQQAVGVLKQTGADHVIYGIKFYDAGEEKIDRFCFYMRPMTDEYFETHVLPIKNAYIYALHKR